jgi:transaldolase
MSHFFHWMTQNTETLFWHDSCALEEVARGIDRGATGVTCNPAIGQRVMRANPDLWATRVRELKDRFPGITLDDLALKALNVVARDSARQARCVWDETKGRQGYVVGQVNPVQMDETEPMIRQAIEATALEPNMGVKIPATAAGMTVIEELAARGKVTLSTVGFTVAQAIAAQEAYERGRKRASKKNDLAFNYSVMIIGRLDEYLVAKAKRENLDIAEADIYQAGLAVTKKINEVLKKRGYPGMCLTGGTRSRYIPQLAGARMCMTIGVVPQQETLAQNPEQRPLGHVPVPEDVIKRLRKAFPEFSQAYDEEGISPSEFTSFPPCREMHDWFITEFNGILDFVRNV